MRSSAPRALSATQAAPAAGPPSASDTGPTGLGLQAHPRERKWRGALLWGAALGVLLAGGALVVATALDGGQGGPSTSGGPPPTPEPKGALLTDGQPESPTGSLARRDAGPAPGVPDAGPRAPDAGRAEADAGGRAPERQVDPTPPKARPVKKRPPGKTGKKRRPPRGSKGRQGAQKRPAKVAVGKLTLRASGADQIRGAGASGRSQASVTVYDGERGTLTLSGPLATKLRYKREGGELSLSVKSTPWAIVRVNNIGKGKTPARLRLKPGRQTKILLKNPKAGELSLTVKYTPTTR